MKRVLSEIIEKYGSDKSLSGYDYYYERIFKFFVGKNIDYLEIGLGTLIPDIPSTFIGNINHYSHYIPAAVLKVWREYFENATIHGIDVGEDCMLNGEENIETFIVDSTNKLLCDEKLSDNMYDIILDDGLHTAVGQLDTLRNFFSRVKDNGLYIIEDVGGGGDGINVYADMKDKVLEVVGEHEYLFRGNILIIHKNYSGKGEISLEQLETSLNKLFNEYYKVNDNLTIVTGLWNIDREGRDFNHYIEAFKRLLDTPQQLYIYIPKEYEYLVWEKRDKKNTVVKIYELNDVKQMYKPFWDQTQKIRKSKKWLNQAEWLKQSPQAKNEWYNPIVQSKMFLLNDVTIRNPFNSEHFFWIDAGITNTVPHGHFAHDDVLDRITKYSEPFLFLSYPYEANKEIHGFDFKAINKYAKTEVKYVCRGGIFGGRKAQINKANATYYSLLGLTLADGYMGTEECIFSIMANIDPVSYRRYELDGNGLIVKFTENVLTDNINLVDIPKQAKSKFNPDIYNNMEKLKTNLYILTFNFPEQLQHTINSMEKTPELLSKPNLYLLDNSTNDKAKKQNQKICKKYNFTYIDNGGNIGINGGRQVAAEHFHASDADFYFFFEDDMTLNGPTEIGKFCRKGFRKYVPDLYKIVHKIMIKEKFDFLKLSFTEVYWDNNIQTSWYNVPQQTRTEYWPEYDQLPVTGIDQNSPRTIFNTINEVDGLSYITGDVFYCNWPMIVSREGNKKMFIDNKWASPYEQTWMSHMFQLTKKGDLKPSILLASPIWHERIHYYKPNERREN